MKFINTRSFSLLVFILSITTVLSQNPREQKYFEAGINEYNLGNYVKADTLFTWCIRMHPNKDAFHNRALCRMKIGNKEGYCADLVNAARLGEENEKLYWTHCGKADTSYVDQDLLPAGKNNYTYLEISYVNFYNKVERVILHDKDKRIIAAYKMIDTIGNVFTFSKNPPKLFENNDKAYWYRAKNLKYPSEFYKRKKNYGVKAEILVLAKGTIYSINLIHNNNDICNECDEEVIKYLKDIPNIKPATFNNINKNHFYYEYMLFDQDKPQR